MNWNPIDKIKPSEDNVEYYVTFKTQDKRRSRGEYQTYSYVIESLYKNGIWYKKQYYPYSDDCDGHYDKEELEFDRKSQFGKVIAWMEIPLYPSPYIEEGE